ncbi:MAG: hypothetical protein EHM33_00880 [Chloroflexi bacterium]|nr:MAG: hypothetical protein EHM33_00880 [Chloroflexota bacterium]
MNVLVGFEQSQEVAAAFIAAGHNAMSCDLYYPGAKGLPHYQGDFFDLLCKRWDLIIIHPPCTYTSLSGNRWYWNSPLRLEGAELCAHAWNEARKWSPKVALEQPKTIMQRYIGKRSQIIQPWMFGHPETKETWLWLWGLPPLEETDNVYELMLTLPKKKRHRIWQMTPGPERQRERSKTYPGIAQAMTQWGN